MVDFNHPLAGKQLDYAVKPVRIISSMEEKGKALVKLLLHQEPESVKAAEKSLKITLNMELPAEIKEGLAKQFKEMVGLEPEFLVSKPEEKPKEEQQAEAPKDDKKE